MMTFTEIFSQQWIDDQQYQHAAVNGVAKLLFDFFHANAAVFGEHDVFKQDNRYLRIGFEQLHLRLRILQETFFMQENKKPIADPTWLFLNMLRGELAYECEPLKIRTTLQMILKALDKDWTAYVSGPQIAFMAFHLKLAIPLAFDYKHIRTQRVAMMPPGTAFYAFIAEPRGDTNDFSDCKLHISVADYMQTARMFNLVAPILYRYFAEFKVLDMHSKYFTEYGPHDFAVNRMREGGQITIYLKISIDNISAIERVLQLISDRLQAHNIRPGVLFSDAKTRYPGITLRFASVLGVYLSARIAGSNYNPINEQSIYLQLLEEKKNDFSMAQHFNKFNLSTFENLYTALLLTYYAYLKTVFNVKVSTAQDIPFNVHAIHHRLKPEFAEDKDTLLAVHMLSQILFYLEALSDDNWQLKMASRIITIPKNFYTGDNFELISIIEAVNQQLLLFSAATWHTVPLLNRRDYASEFVSTCCDYIKSGLPHCNSPSAIAMQIMLCEQVLNTALTMHDLELIAGTLGQIVRQAADYTRCPRMLGQHLLLVSPILNHAWQDVAETGPLASNISADPERAARSILRMSCRYHTNVHEQSIHAAHPDKAPPSPVL